MQSPYDSQWLKIIQYNYCIHDPYPFPYENKVHMNHVLLQVAFRF